MKGMVYEKEDIDALEFKGDISQIAFTDENTFFASAIAIYQGIPSCKGGIYRLENNCFMMTFPLEGDVGVIMQNEDKYAEYSEYWTKRIAVWDIDEGVVVYKRGGVDDLHTTGFDWEREN